MGWQVTVEYTHHYSGDRSGETERGEAKPIKMAVGGDYREIVWKKKNEALRYIRSRNAVNLRENDLHYALGKEVTNTAENKRVYHFWSAKDK